MPEATKDKHTNDQSNEKNTLGRNQAHIQHQSLYDDDMDDYQHYHGGDEDGYDDDEEAVEEDDDSVLSIPDPNINFDLVYALHTFAASVEGQATVVKGDALTLLDDSNSYWWLVKVLKTSEVGYIPAENIETPYERLARLNSHRNIELTRRDIQDAFPVPPSNKSSSTKKVTLAKGVKFQAQVIIGSSDDEDFEEEYEEWHENMLSSETDSGEESSFDDDYEYMDDKHMYATDDYHDGPSEADTYKPGYQQQKQAFYQQPQHHQQYQYQHHQQQQEQEPEPQKQQPEPQQEPQPQPQQPQPQQPQQSQQKIQISAQVGGDHEYERRPSEGSLESKGSRSMSFRDTLDLEQSETIKISLTPSIARDSEDSVYQDSEAMKLKKQSKFEQLLNNDAPTQQTRNGKEKEKKEKSGIRKFFSRNKDKDNKDKKKKPSDKDSISETASFSSQSTGYSDKEHISSIDSAQREEAQPAMLKIFAGNVRFGAEYKVAHAYDFTTAAELVQQATESFDIVGYRATVDEHLEYYLTVKGVDGDAYTLVPSDKPLAIYHSLTAHLNTPMPSLKKARRISQLMSTTESAHMGGPKNGASEIEEVRFYLHTKARRLDEKEGHVSIKVSLFASEVDGPTSILKHDQNRVDKMVTVAPNALVSDVTGLLLEKFHVLNGVVDGMDVDEKIRSLRLQGSEIDAVKYRLTVSRQGQEYLLAPTAPISNAFGDDQPPVHYRRSSNPDRSSVTSTSSTIGTPRPEETFFILRRSHQPEGGSTNTNNRPARPHRPTRQNTPMPRRDPLTRGLTPEQPVPQVHPLERQGRGMSASPVDTMILDSTASWSAQQSLTDEPEEAKDMLLKLDEEMDNLAHTRNSNEPLTEAITSQMTTQQTPEPVAESPTERKNRNGNVVESMLFCDDFGMDELMVMIRGAARLEDESVKPKQTLIRSEISEIYKDSHMRLDQVEKELDRLMTDAIRVYF